MFLRWYYPERFYDVQGVSLKGSKMLSKKILLIMLSAVALWTGGCAKEKSEGPGEENAWEEYTSTLLNSLDKAKKTS
jgi:hypothetical protein